MYFDLTFYDTDFYKLGQRHKSYYIIDTASSVVVKDNSVSFSLKQNFLVTSVARKPDL